MELWLNFIGGVIHSMAWPAFLIVVVWIFRSPLSQILSSIETVKYKNIEVTVNQILEEAETELPSNVPEADKPQSKEARLLYALAKDSPNEAVLRAWKTVERAAFDASVRLGGPPARYLHSSESFIRQLEKSDIVNEVVVALIRELQDLKNQIIESRFQLSVDATIRYVDIALRIAKYLDRIPIDEGNKTEK